jgi:Bacterial mobilisation protein (MobC)
MPRSRKSTTGEIRDQVIPIRLSATELRYVKERAGSLSLSEFFRKAGLGQSIPQRRKRQILPQLHREMLLELGKIGGNLNQIARACSLTIHQGISCDVDLNLLMTLQETIRKLSSQIGGMTPEDEEEDE